MVLLLLFTISSVLAPASPSPSGVPGSVQLMPFSARYKLTSDGVSPTTLSVSWTPGTGICLFYSLEYSSSGPSGPWTSPAFVRTGSSAYVYDLSPGATGWWRVVYTLLTYSNRAPFPCVPPVTTWNSTVLKVAQPSAAVLSLTQPTSGSAQLQWTNRATYGGSVAFGSYQIVESVNRGPYSAVTTINGESTMTYTVTGLLSGRSYSFFVNTTDQCSGCPGGTYPSSSFSNIESLGPPVPPTTYAATFMESGLPSGTSWSVTLDGVTESATGSTITFTEPNGTYTYTIGAVPGYSTTSYAGSIEVHGSVVTQTVPWTQVTYALTFEESGLPPGASWSVSVQGAAQSSTTTTDVFNEPNGTYSYTVSAVTGYVALPSSGTITVNGASVTQTIAFSAVASGPTISSFSASASSITLGSSVTLAVTATGGTGRLTYAYAGLPSGCASANVSALTCSPTATGSFTITVTVTDAVGQSTTATVALFVNPALTVSPTIFGLDPPVLFGATAFVIAIAVAGVVLAIRGKKRAVR
ncbi:MAG TPA: hypothetical protein VGA48_00080 [Thermoplasmata archaeon]